MNLIKKNIFLVSVLWVAQLAHAQKAFTVLAGEASGSGGSISYNVGQVFYTTNTGPTGSLSPGLQQPFEFQTLSNPELTTVKLTAVTYPNPTSNYVILKISDSALENLSYKFFDVTGKVISHGTITNEDTQIGMQQLAIGIYILKVNRHDQELKSFKIIKK